MTKAPERQRQQRRQGWGRAIARLLCLVFAVAGAVPFSLGLLLRTSALTSHVATMTRSLLQRELGISAQYRVTLETWPLSVVLSDVVVESNDGGEPAVRVSRLTVRPRIFSLLANRFDAGQIDIEGLKTRLVVRDGRLQNVSYRLPSQSEDSEPVREAPFSSLALTDASVSLDWEGARLQVRDLDLDVSAERGPAFEIALRAGQQWIDRERPVLSVDNSSGGMASDEDTICQIDTRLRLTRMGLLVRRLTVHGAVDLDEAPGTRPPCQLDQDDPRRLELELSHLQVRWKSGAPPQIDGAIHARAPVALTHRFVPFVPLRGYVEADVEGQYGQTGVLPRLRGTVHAKGFQLERYRLASDLLADVAIEDDVIRSEKATVAFADGIVTANKLTVEPLKKGAPLHVMTVDSANVRFTSLMRDLGVSQHAHVSWFVRSSHVPSFEGTLVPLKLDGEFTVLTSDFEVFDKGFDDPARRHMIGVHDARLAGHLAVRPDSVTFRGARADFGSSHLETTVTLGFSNSIDLTVGQNSQVDLADISPLANLKMVGKSTVTADMHGPYSNPLLVGDLSVQGFSLHGFPIGDVTSKVRFSPLALDFTEARGRKGKSSFDIPSGRLDFNGPASLRADAVVSSPDLYVRDFLHMWHFETDPRFDGIDGHGTVKAQVRYDLGGPADRCGGGALSVKGALHLVSAELFDEHYDGADSEFNYYWPDPDASSLGLDLDLHSLTLRKGRGSIFGSVTVRRGGAVRGSVAMNELPLSHLQAFGSMGRLLDGTVSGVGTFAGTLDDLEADIDARVSTVRIGNSSLGPSHVHVALEPLHAARVPIGKTKCGQPTFPPFDRAEYDRDTADGTFHATGELFGGQVELSDLQITRQRNKVSSGRVRFSDLRLEPFGQLVARGRSGGTAGGAAVTQYGGSLTGTLDIRSFALSSPERINASLTLEHLTAMSPIARVALQGSAPTITIQGDQLSLPPLDLKISAGSGFQGRLVVQGEVLHLNGARELDLTAALDPAPLSNLETLFPKIERASGTVQASLRVTGSTSHPAYAGEAHIANGELSLHGLALPISNLGVDLAILGEELRIVRGQATVGGGTVSLAGRVPIHGLRLGEGAALITAKGISVPVVEGVNLTCDADLRVDFLERDREEAEPPMRLSGEVLLTSFMYTRPIGISADINSLTNRERRKTFESYDPRDDFVSLDIRLRSREPLRLSNNLIEAQLATDSDALMFTGTNQRYGLRGRLRLLPSGRIRFRSNEFEIRQGYVKFEDPDRIAPRIDVTAVTEYRKYSATSTAAAGAHVGGSYRITLHAQGDSENLRLDMTSEPSLTQEDILLLLAVGLTRAEFDQGQASNLGMEALSQLTGADAAVRKVVPVIDDLRFNTWYSSRAGTTEPAITASKRLTEGVKANVTTGLSDNRQVRVNLEGRVTPKVSVQANYDNVNDVSSSSIGNLGADIRYRLEFQ